MGLAVRSPPLYNVWMLFSPRSRLSSDMLSRSFCMSSERRWPRCSVFASRAVLTLKSICIPPR